MNRRTVLRLGAVTALGAFATDFGSSAFAQQKLVLKATDVHPLGYPTVEAVVRMGKKLEAATGGRLSVQMYPSMQLGGEKEMIEQAQVGRARHRAHQRRPDGADRAGAQRVQPAVHVPRRRAHGEGDRRSDRRRAAQEALRPSDRRLDRPVLDERRHPQRLQQQEAGPFARRPQGPEDPHDGQPGVRRHHERARRQRRRHGLRPAHQRACRPAWSTARRTTIRPTPPASTIATPSTTP